MDQPPPEDLLRDLIDHTEASRDVLHGVKRPHDNETTDEPQAKRDKLGEELERMFASHPSLVSNTVPSSSSAFTTVAAGVDNTPTTNGTSAAGSGNQITAVGSRGTLPIRASRRRLLHLGHGTDMSLNEIPEASEPTTSNSGDDKSEHSSDGQEV